MIRLFRSTVIALAILPLPWSGFLHASTRHDADEDIRASLRAGQFAVAERLARQRLAAVELESGAESVETADVLDLLSEAMRQGGRGGLAEVGPNCERAVRIKEKALGKEDPSYAASLYQLGCWCYVNGDFGKARPLLQESLRIRESKLGPDHPDVASSLLMLGTVYSETGDHTTAKAMVERALSIRQAVDPSSPGVAECLNALAGALTRMGDYASSEPMYRKAIKIWVDAWGDNHVRVGTGWNNLSAVLLFTGDYEGALSAMDKALHIRIKTLGPDHEMVAWTRANMAMNLAAMGRKVDARDQYRKAIRIQEARFGRDSPEVGWTLKRLGDTYLAPGEYEKAVPILERAVSNFQQGEVPDNPDIAEAMAALGAARTALGDTASGNELYRRAVVLLERRLGHEHPEVGFTLTQQAGALMVAGATRPALEAALQGEDVSREHLRLMCRTMPERAALAYAESRPAGGRLALSILTAVARPDPDLVSRTWDSLIRSRTMVLDEMALRMRMVSESKDPEIKRLAGKLAFERRRLANLLVSGPGDATDMRYRSSLEKARESTESAERALGRESALFSRDRARGRVGLKETLAAMPDGAALVAYALAGQGRDRSYVAFLARAGSQEAFFTPIAPAAKVETAISRWLTAVNAAGKESSRSNDPSRTWGDSLAALVWAPIAPRLEGVRRLFIVGEGGILLVNFDALPVGRSRYLVEEGRVLHYLNSERDLVPTPSDVRPGTGLLAVGDPAFDLGPAKSAGRTAGDESVHRDAWGCGDFRSVRFSQLPKSGAEAREIARIWGDPAHARVLTGAAANERTIKADAPGRRVLHLATHGFFLGDACEGTSAGTRGIGGMVPSSRSNQAKARPTPIQLSGLALAGANERNQAGPNDEDGVLTAEEIASLNLTGMDWAVLSACDTGKGRIQVGEGVLGLRRAFQAAGARTVIMSLWSVDDESTRAWMEALYDGRVVRKLDTADAVTQADLQVLRARRAQARSTDPFYWAGFVATGDWR